MEDVDLKALRRGDNRAWDTFVERYTALLYASVQRTLKKYNPNHTPDDVLDIVQNVFVRLTQHDFRLLKNFDSTRASLSTWLVVIAHSATIDYLRKQPMTPQSLPEQIPSPEKVSSPERPEGRIDLPVGLLSERQRIVMMLYFDYDMDVKEIANLLGITPQTVRSTKHKGIMKLRRYFGKKEVHPNDRGPNRRE